MPAEKIFANNEIKSFFEDDIELRDPEIYNAILGERK